MSICAFRDLVRAYEARRNPSGQSWVYERYLTTPWLWRYEADAPELGWAMKRLAELSDARGELTARGLIDGVHVGRRVRAVALATLTSNTVHVQTAMSMLL